MAAISEASKGVWMLDIVKVDEVDQRSAHDGTSRNRGTLTLAQSYSVILILSP